MQQRQAADAGARLLLLAHASDELLERRQLDGGRERAIAAASRRLDECRTRALEAEDAIQRSIVDALRACASATTMRTAAAAAAPTTASLPLDEESSDGVEAPATRLAVKADGVSMSSGANLSLAMDAGEIETDRDDEATAAGCDSADELPAMAMEAAAAAAAPQRAHSSEKLDRLYTLLDDYESRLDADERLIYDGVAEKQRQLDVSGGFLTTNILPLVTNDIFVLKFSSIKQKLFFALTPDFVVKSDCLFCRRWKANLSMAPRSFNVNR